MTREETVKEYIRLKKEAELAKREVQTKLAWAAGLERELNITWQEVYKELRELESPHSNEKIKAIIAYRMRYGCGLREAMNAVDEYLRTNKL